MLNLAANSNFRSDIFPPVMEISKKNLVLISHIFPGYNKVSGRFARRKDILAVKKEFAPLFPISISWWAPSWTDWWLISPIGFCINSVNGVMVWIDYNIASTSTVELRVSPYAIFLVNIFVIGSHQWPTLYDPIWRGHWLEHVAGSLKDWLDQLPRSSISMDTDTFLFTYINICREEGGMIKEEGGIILISSFSKCIVSFLTRLLQFADNSLR